MATPKTAVALDTPDVDEPADTEVRVVADPSASPELAERLRSWERPGGPILVVHRGPAPIGVQSLRQELMRALGKDSDQFDTRCSDLEVWLSGEHPADIIVEGAETLDEHALALLIHLARDAAARLWLTAADPAQLRLPVGVRAHEAPESALLRLEPRVTEGPPLPLPARLPGLPPIPVSRDFISFRYDMRQLLEPDAFALVDDIWRDAYQAAEVSMGDTHVYTGTEARAVELRITIFALLNSQIATCTCEDEAVIRLRAIQARLLLATIWLRWDVPQRPDPLATATPLHTQVTAARCGRLRQLADPARAALGVLALATECGSPSFGELQVEDVADDGSWVALPGKDKQPITIAKPGRGILAAQRRAALAHHPQDFDHWPLVFSRIGAAIPPHQLRQDLTSVCALLDLPLSDFTQPAAKDVPGARWMANRRLSIQVAQGYPSKFEPVSMNEAAASAA